MKQVERVKERINEIVRKDCLDWADWNRLLNEIEIYFDLESTYDTKIVTAQREALTHLYDTIYEYGVNLDDKTLNSHYIQLCQHTLYFL